MPSILVSGLLTLLVVDLNCSSTVSGGINVGADHG